MVFRFPKSTTIIRSSFGGICSSLAFWGIHADSKTVWPKKSLKYFSWFYLCNSRLFSIVLGLMALKQATISFVETVKSSSPIFTVFISKFLIGEYTGFWTKLSLFPIMMGLALCSSFEINFSTFGLVAAILTNFTEWYKSTSYKFIFSHKQFARINCIFVIFI